MMAVDSFFGFELELGGIVTVLCDIILMIVDVYPPTVCTLCHLLNGYRVDTVSLSFLLIACVLFTAFVWSAPFFVDGMVQRDHKQIRGYVAFNYLVLILLVLESLLFGFDIIPMREGVFYKIKFAVIILIRCYQYVIVKSIYEKYKKPMKAQGGAKTAETV